MLTIKNQPEDNFLNGWNLLLGAGLIAAPWYFGFAAESVPTRSGVAAGALIVTLAAFALRQTFEWQEYAIGLLGLWACAAPWALGFLGHNAPTWAHAGFGLAVIISAAAEVWRLHDTPAAFRA